MLSTATCRSSLRRFQQAQPAASSGDVPCWDGSAGRSQVGAGGTELPGSVLLLPLGSSKPTETPQCFSRPMVALQGMC